MNDRVEANIHFTAPASEIDARLRRVTLAAIRAFGDENIPVNAHDVSSWEAGTRGARGRLEVRVRVYVESKDEDYLAACDTAMISLAYLTRPGVGHDIDVGEPSSRFAIVQPGTPHEDAGRVSKRG